MKRATIDAIILLLLHRKVMKEKSMPMQALLREVRPQTESRPGADG